jgi:hypothetical protein
LTFIERIRMLDVRPLWPNFPSLPAGEPILLI